MGRKILVIITLFVLTVSISACVKNTTDKTELTRLIDICQEYIFEDYTTESWGIFLICLEEAIAIKDNSNASQNEVNEVTANLENKIAMLVSVTTYELTNVKADKLNEIPSLKDYEESDYTQESWLIFKAAVEADIAAINSSETVVEVENYHITANDIVLVRVATLKFETNGGIAINAVKVVHGANAVLPTPIKSGNTFIGWYVDGTLMNEFGGTMPSVDTTIYARWFEGDATIVCEGESIQSAIDNADSNTIIFVKAGVFVENIVINKPITLLGNNYNIKGYQTRLRETVITVPSGENVETFFGSVNIEINSSDVTFQGFSVLGNNQSVENIWTQNRQDAVYTGTTSYGTVGSSAYYSYNYLKTFIGTDVGIDSSVGIYVTPTSATSQATNVVIQNNVMSDFWQAGIYVYGWQKSALTFATVKDNLIKNVVGLAFTSGGKYAGHYGRAVSYDHGAEGFIYGNRITDSVQGIHVQGNPGAKNLSIEANDFINVNNGAWINSSKDINISILNNNFYFEDDFVKTANYITLNTANNAAIVITSLENMSNVIIDGNTISKYLYGIAVTCIPQKTSLIISNTTFYDIEGVCLYIPETIMGYKFTAITFITIGESNFYNGNNKLFFDDANLNKTAYVTENGVETKYGK